jgi:hypothetical protein
VLKESLGTDCHLPPLPLQKWLKIIGRVKNQTDLRELATDRVARKMYAVINRS